MDTRTLTLLDETGDTTIAWDSERDAEFKALIKKKMDQGMNFFIVQPRFGGFFHALFGDKRKKISDVSQITENKVQIPDEDFMKLMGAKGAMALNSQQEYDDIKVVKKSTNAEEISRNHSVGVRPITAG